MKVFGKLLWESALGRCLGSSLGKGFFGEALEESVLGRCFRKELQENTGKDAWIRVLGRCFRKMP